jgi:hypothetical protein
MDAAYAYLPDCRIDVVDHATEMLQTTGDMELCCREIA